jgi:lincosamide nucleotidyltransferase A/C/D/E
MRMRLACVSTTAVASAILRRVTADDVLEILHVLAGAGIHGCLDGGWGVDALATEQTRTHSDVDIAIDAGRLDDASQALAHAGYRRDETAEPGLPARYVMQDAAGRQVDLHLLTFDERGNGWQRLTQGEAWGLYPAAERATGLVAGEAVGCISAALQHRFHLGWEWDDKAKHDMALLGKRFALPLPPRRHAPGAAQLGTR